ncbi:MAG: zinc ribbon domain-containing protein, partial [Fibromonadaceae bacterium]|nr:zinc ribbon domain-containing protein [Fibromonadaceae bacterium]
MALIKCPECEKQISDKAENCPHCGCPKQYFTMSMNEGMATKDNKDTFDHKEVKNMLIMFSSDWRSLFSAMRYIAKSAADKFFNVYSKYAIILRNPLVQSYI